MAVGAACLLRGQNSPKLNRFSEADFSSSINSIRDSTTLRPHLRGRLNLQQSEHQGRDRRDLCIAAILSPSGLAANGMPILLRLYIELLRVHKSTRFRSEFPESSLYYSTCLNHTLSSIDHRGRRRSSLSDSATVFGCYAK
jgi:hypothetical protein